MPRKTRDPRQRSLFSNGSGDLPEPPHSSSIQPEGGDHHAVQDDSSRIPATTAPDVLAELRKNRQLLATLERYANELKASHDAWKEVLVQVRPNSEPHQIRSEALETALKEMEDRMSSALEHGEDESQVLEAAMLFLRCPTSCA